MKKIGLFFGTFNPIHNGHLKVANYFVEKVELEEVWLVIILKAHSRVENSNVESLKTFQNLKFR